MASQAIIVFTIQLIMPYAIHIRPANMRHLSSAACTAISALTTTSPALLPLTI
jgi:hypothetical protein